MRLKPLRGQRKSCPRSGLAVVEAALLFPLLLLLLAGIWEVGRMVEATQVLSNAAREGARQASTGGKTAAQVETAVKNYLTAAGINNANCNVRIINLTQNPTPPTSGPSDEPGAAVQLDHMRVTITLPFNNVRWVLINQVTTISSLTAKADWFCMRDQPLTVDATMPVN